MRDVVRSRELGDVDEGQETCSLLAKGDPGVAWLGWKDSEDERPWTGNTGYPDLPLRHNAPEHRTQTGFARHCAEPVS